MRKIRIVLTGGGSGGHTYPLVAVAESLRRLANANSIDLSISYLGPKDQWSALLEGYGIKVRYILGAKVRRYASLLNLLDVPKFFISIVQALFKLFWLMPDAVFSKGGPGALAVVCAAWFYRIPVVIHESDAVPGFTNRISARFAKRVAVSFDRALAYFDPRKVVWTGHPVREEILADNLTAIAAKESLHFMGDEPLLLVLGGSQGSQRINEFIVLILKDIIREVQILHQTGAAHIEDIKKLAAAALADPAFSEEVKAHYRPVGYLDDHAMRAALTAADLVVARAGSNVFEIAAFGKPAILFPLPEAANNHQRVNAYEFAKSGGALVIEEQNLLPDIFLTQLRSVLKNPVRMNQMALGSAKFFKKGAAEEIATEVLARALRSIR